MNAAPVNSLNLNLPWFVRVDNELFLAVADVEAGRLALTCPAQTGPGYRHGAGAGVMNM